LRPTSERANTVTSKILEIRDLDVAYQNIQALYGVSMDINEGELLVVLGANGAGKTTLLKTISGILEPTRGSIHLQGDAITGILPSEIVKRGICHCPEGRKIFPKMTVWKNITLGAYTRKDRAGVVEDLERMLGLFPILRDRKSQIAGSLSGGEQQMLAIARALMGRPKLLLLDEPSIGLSPLLVSKVAEYIARINRDGIPILLVEQNARVALSIAHRCYVLERGKIALEGAAGKILSMPEVVNAYLGT
jgi:branched-chain amino acid transport system ATP-binding protein